MFLICSASRICSFCLLFWCSDIVVLLVRIFHDCVVGHKCIFKCWAIELVSERCIVSFLDGRNPYRRKAVINHISSKMQSSTFTITPTGFLPGNWEIPGVSTLSLKASKKVVFHPSNTMICSGFLMLFGKNFRCLSRILMGSQWDGKKVWVLVQSWSKTCVYMPEFRHICMLLFWRSLSLGYHSCGVSHFYRRNLKIITW